MIKKIIWLIIILLIAAGIIYLISGFYLDFEWFRANNGLNILKTFLFTKFYVHALFALIFIALFYLNFLLMRLLSGKGRVFSRNNDDNTGKSFPGTGRRVFLILLFLAVAAGGIIMGFGASAYWKEFLMYIHSVPFNGFPADPVFGRDIGFYVFSLPFYKFLYRWLMAVLIIITVFSVIVHVINGGFRKKDNRLGAGLFTRTHLSILLSMIVLLLGIGYRIAAYGLLYSQRGKFFGAGYTAVNAELLAYNVCMYISFAAAALLLFNIIKRSIVLPAVVLLALAPAYYLLGSLYPSLQQRFVVEPNELDKERPYIEYNIKYTRLAYGLENVIEKQFANDEKLTYREIVANRNIIRNIRLWDWRPLKLTYKQLQELKPYYQFYDVDVDRYIINKAKTAVNLSAREMDISRISEKSRTWVNNHLVYTHGYGAVLSRVDEVTSEGLPEMLVYNIPTKVKIPISIVQPRIYYGEHKNPYVITNTGITPGEFDYPYGDRNEYTKYSGSGGSLLDSFFKRLLFALSFKDKNILISGSIKKESRILFWRNINEMVTKFTPFLDFDKDPYLVIADGKFYWIIDAYTTSDMFPYSTPIKKDKKEINYIRNSVKVVIDAYNGTMDYYIADEKDPVVKTYSNMFPGLFKKLSEMPDYLRSHIRYPEEIFNIQAEVLLRYHMTNVNVFYNNEDRWAIPRQIYESKEEPVESYYLVTSLPGEKEEEFILTIPFTPVNRDNMTAFLIIKCDPPSYGEMILYSLPKDKLNFGPMQIESRINQDPEISQLLTLWSQEGSGVIRGNIMVIPIEESFLFIEPLYLKAETSEMPQLRRVIVSFKDRIVIDEDLGKAVEKLFLYNEEFSETAGDAGAEDFEISVETKLKMTAGKAYSHFMKAEEYRKNGDWSAYGKELERLKELLIQMKDLTE